MNEPASDELLAELAALREQGNLFRVLFEHAPIGMAITDLPGRYVNVNAAHCQALGYTTEELYGRNYVDISHPDDVPLNRRLREEAIRGERADFQMDKRFITKAGGLIHTLLRVSLVRDEAGRPHYFIGQIVDITERRQAEETLRRYARRLEILHRIDRGILRSESPEAIAQLVLDELRQLMTCRWACVVQFNALTGQTRLLGAFLDGEPGGARSKFHSFTEPDRAAFWEGRVRLVPDITALTRPLPLERALLARGIRTYLHVPFVIKGELTGFLNLGAEQPGSLSPEDVEVAQEVAVSLAIAVQQARLYRQTQEDAQTKARLLQEVNHRVKNNLASIAGMLYLTRRYARAAPAESQGDFFDSLIRRIDGMAAAHQLLSDNQWASLSLADLADRVLRPSLAGLPLATLDLQQQQPLSPVQVSPKQANDLALVLSELATNSLKYAGPAARPLALTLRLACQDGLVSLEFQDNGPGFPPEVLRRERQNIGLYLVRAIVEESLRGRLALANRDGALVVVEFPQEF